MGISCVVHFMVGHFSSEIFCVQTFSWVRIHFSVKIPQVGMHL